MRIATDNYYFNGPHRIICRSNIVLSLVFIIPVRLLRGSDGIIKTHIYL